jgi:UDP:flavonoid glycosyltransferase YjiC (YdhE family)
MTHYGWYSTMEAITAELPVVTWPHFMDQSLNQKMVVEVLCIGISVGITELLLYQKVE